MRHYALALCLLVPAYILSADDIESAKVAILAILHQKNPAVIAEFKDFYRQYNQSVLTFFDTKNNDSLQTHITRMEGELNILRNVCSNAEFRHVQHILHIYSAQIEELMTLLKKYVGSKNTLSLALKVQHFTFLLPPTVKKRGNLALFKALHHRLRCP